MQKKMMEEIEGLLQNHFPDRHSFFQLKNFVLDAEPTVQAKLHKCLCELRWRVNTVKNQQRELDELADKIALAMIEKERIAMNAPEGPDLGEVYDDLEYALSEREHAILLRQVQRKIDALEEKREEIKTKMGFCTEECQFWVQAFKQLSAQEELKPWDDLTVQKEYWDAKLSNTMKMKLILGHPLDEELVRCALALDDRSSSKKYATKLIQSVQESLGNDAPQAVAVLSTEGEACSAPSCTEDNTPR